MEKPLTIHDCKNLQRGDAILVDAFNKNELMVFATKMPVAKYPLTQNGRKCRSIGIDKPMIFADQENCTGNEKIMQYEFLGGASNFTVKSTTELKGFNVRLIDDKHPLYNPILVKSAKAFGDGFDRIQDIFKF